MPTMHRRHFLALTSIALSAASTSIVVADCAPNEERAGWLTTNVHPGGDAFVWLGQPRGLPVPTDLEVTISGASSRLPIVWVVPGVARLRVPGTASGVMRIATPPRGRGPTGATFDVTLASGPPPARISAPPSGLSLARSRHPIRWGEAEDVEARFAAAPPSVRHVIMRWSRFGAAASLAAGTTRVSVYMQGGCGSSPVDAAPPARGERVELAFLDDEGNVSSFTSAVMPA
ncbi:MAG: hypothetical protein J0L92_05945 [Deltaproteobacteria bacterium]|nr:hypothetical protein [Deltaproteobacteria bacterium]